jgi:hypothetical protein
MAMAAEAAHSCTVPDRTAATVERWNLFQGKGEENCAKRRSCKGGYKCGDQPSPE